MILKEYKFYLRIPLGNYYFVDSLGVVTQIATKQELGSIIDWDTLTFNYERHPVYFGMYKKYTPDSVRFVGDAMKILRYIVRTQDIEGYIVLEVEELDKTNLTYSLVETFKLDLSKHSDKYLTFDCPIIPQGLSNVIDTYDNTIYEVALETPDGIVDTEYIKLDGLGLQGSYNYETTTGNIISFDMGNESAATRVISDAFTMGIVYKNKEGDLAIAVGQANLPMIDVGVDIVTGDLVGSGGDFNNAFIFHNIDEIYEFELSAVTGSIRAIYESFSSSDADVNLSLRAVVYNSPDWDVSHIIAGDFEMWGVNNVTSGFISGSVDLTITPFGISTLPANSWVVVYFRMQSSTAIPFGDEIHAAITLDAIASQLQVKYLYVKPATYCRALRHDKYFTQLVAAMGDLPTAYGFRSDYLSVSKPAAYGNGLYDLNPRGSYITCGDAIRQLYSDAMASPVNPAIKINFADFERDMFTVNGCGVGIELDDLGSEIVRCERLEYFFDDSKIITDLGSNIDNFEIIPYIVHRGNNLKFGYKDNTYSDLNGRYEYNSETLFVSPLSNSIKDIDYTSPIRADSYGIELVRINSSNKSSTDTSSDNDAFNIQANLAVETTDGIDYHTLERNEHISDGIPAIVASTSFNVVRSPKRNMGRLTPFLKSNYEGLLANPVLLFKSAKKNKLLSSSSEYSTVEWDDLNLAAMPELPLYKPFVFRFESPTPVKLKELMEGENKYGKFTFTLITPTGESVPLSGFPLKCGVNKAELKPYVYELLCSPTCTIPEYI